jgi:hypothetical protein
MPKDMSKSDELYDVILKSFNEKGCWECFEVDTDGASEIISRNVKTYLKSVLPKCPEDMGMLDRIVWEICLTEVKARLGLTE